MAIAMRCPFVVSRKYLLKPSQSKDFLKFWRNLLSHDLPHRAIWVKFVRPVFVRKSSMVSMKKVWKGLLKFVWPESAFEIISLSWIRGLIFIKVTGFVVTSKLLKIKHLSKLFEHYFPLFLTLFSVSVLCRSSDVARYSDTGCCIVSIWKLFKY